MNIWQAILKRLGHGAFVELNKFRGQIPSDQPFTRDISKANIYLYTYNIANINVNLMMVCEFGRH